MGTVGAETSSEAGANNSPANTPNSVAPSASTPPAWAERLKRGDTISRSTSTVAHVLQSGDSHGGGHSVDLSEGNN